MWGVVTNVVAEENRKVVPSLFALATAAAPTAVLAQPGFTTMNVPPNSSCSLWATISVASQKRNGVNRVTGRLAIRSWMAERSQQPS